MSGEMREVVFDRQAYGIDAIQKAAYRFIDRMAVNFQVTDTQVRCEVSVDTGASTIDDVIHEFQKEVLDQHLRLKIASETESIRHLILAHAFSRTGLT